MKSNSDFKAPLNPSLYELLGVSRTIDKIGLRARFRELCKIEHPDVSKWSPKVATERFRYLLAAFRFLLNEQSRKAYDEELAAFEKKHNKNDTPDERYGWTKEEVFLDFATNYKNPDYDWSIGATTAKRSFGKDVMVFLVVCFRDFVRDSLNKRRH